MKIENVKPADIEKRSFEIITETLEETDVDVDPRFAHIIKRCIHTSADFDYARTMFFSEGVEEKIASVIKSGGYIVTDTKMALSGINKKRIEAYGGKVLCFIGDEDVAAAAKDRGLTRSYVSMEKALSFLQSASETALRAYGFPDCSSKAERTAKALEEAVPELQRSLLRDAEAGFEGDPAARSIGEVILCYPIIRTLTMHRTAHLLYMHGIPLIPRMMNEVMHSSTGIDIHPGATIGERFFIDHGTGVVIGETTIIGNSVKLYQGVTLGALSIPKKGCGQILEGAKRHPTIEDNVTIYANATILGDITIGRNSVIASNAWIRESIPPDSIVKTAMPEIRVRPRRKE